MPFSRLLRFAGFVLVMSPARSIAAQTPPRPTAVAISLGVQTRSIGATDESRIGGVGEVLVRRQHERTGYRISLGAAHFTSSDPFVGRLCNPDGPCMYYAPALTVATAAIGAEWGVPRGPRALLGVGAYQLLSKQAQGTAPNLPSARRGVRRTAGVQIGLVSSLPGARDRVELEVRYERLAAALESTNYFLPVMFRVHW